MSLLQMSMSATIMILAVTAIRFFVINRLPKATFLALWGVVLLRLLIPFSLPSPFSVYSVLNSLPVVDQVNTVFSESFPPTAPAPPTTPFAGLPITTPEAMPAPILHGIDPWFITWLVGAVVCTIYFAVLYLACHRKFLVASRLENDFVSSWLSEHKIMRTIRIRSLGGISAPLTYGVFRPVILMPEETDWSDSRQLEYILEHEYVHIRRFDAATKLLLTAAVCVHWFNPLVWVMYLLANRDIELSCDEAVVRSFGEAVKSDYALTLIGMEEKKSGLVPFYNSFSKNSIEERIGAIMKYKKSSLAAITAAFVLVLCVTTGFATSSKSVLPQNEALNSATSLNDTVEQPSNVEDKSDNSSSVSIVTPSDAHSEYPQFGITYDEVSGRYYLNGSPARYFEDKEKNIYAGAYDDGQYNVYVVRDANGTVTGLETLDIKTDAVAIKFREYSDFGLQFKNTASNGMELNGNPISSFSDVAAGVGVSRQSGGDNNEYEAVRSTSDSGPVGVGRLVSIRQIVSAEPLASSVSGSQVDAEALDIMQRTGNWGYLEDYLPKMTDGGIDAVVSSYNSKHPNPAEHKKAADYYN